MVKGQSAMEYLIVFGWSFLIVSTIIAILFYSGITDSLIYRDNKVMGFSTINVYQFEIFANQNIILVLDNDADVDLTINDIEFDDCSITGVSYPFDMTSGERVIVNGQITKIVDEHEYISNIPLKIKYIVNGGTREHIDSGMLSTRVNE